MSDLLNSISLTDEDLERFQREGVLILRGLWTKKTIQIFSKAFERQSKASVRGLRAKYSRIRHTLEEDTNIISQIIYSSIFGELMKKLTGRGLLYAQSLGLEAEPCEEKIVEWHFDQTSYGYVDTSTPVYGLWSPLIPISKNTQSGGLAWVPEHILSAKDSLKRWQNYLYRLYDLDCEFGSDYEASCKEFNYVKEEQWVTPEESKFMESQAVEADFEIGDAVLMKRNVWHKVNPFLPGPYKRRAVVVMRFLSEEARLDRRLFEGITTHARIEDRVVPKIFISRLLDLPDGALIRNSQYSSPVFPK